MSERFKKLYELPNNLYSNGAPILVSGGALLYDSATRSIIVQLKYQSLSITPIVALKVCICAYDIQGNELDGVDGYQYLDLNVLLGDKFGSNKAIIMPNSNTRSFEIKSITIIKSNGEDIGVTLPMKPLPKLEPLSKLIESKEALKQYKIETTCNSIYVPQEYDNLWCCACGEWNITDTCSNCEVSKEDAFKFLNISLLESRIQPRLKKEKLEKEKLEKETKKRKYLTISFILIAIIAIVCIISGFIHSSQHKYDNIAGIYALQNLDDAEEALYKYQKDIMDEYGFNPYSYEIDIRGSGKVYGLWFVNDRGSMTPRAATVKSVSDKGVIVFDVLDYPNEYVSLTVNLETGEAIYSSRNLTLTYRRISEELANNGYQECSKEEVQNDISFIQKIFELKTVEAICENYPNATTIGAKYDLKIEGSFCGAYGTYEIALDDEWKIYFTQGIYDINTEKQTLIDNLDGVLRKNNYSEKYETYTWESEEYNLQIVYYPHKGIYFYFDVSVIESPDNSNDNSNESGSVDESQDTFISDGRFTFNPRSYVTRFDESDKNMSDYNFVYMRMNGETSLFYELAEISGGYDNVRSVGLMSFVKNIDTTLTIDEDYTENIITKINVLVEKADDVPPILVSCMCAADPSLDFTSAYNLSFEVAENAGSIAGYTHNGVNYVIFADTDYYYIIISVAEANDDEPKSECDVLGHSWINATCTIPMTCSRCGETNGAVLGHDWGNPTCTTPRSCCVCFEIDPNSKPLGHSFVDGECMVCGVDDPDYYVLTSTTYNVVLEDDSYEVYITMTGGDVVVYEIDDTSIVLCEWGDWDGDTLPLTFFPVSVGNTFVTVYIKEHDISIKINVTVNEHSHNYISTIINPSCTDQGYTIYACECGDTYNYDYIEAIGHTVVIDKEVKSTCAATGLTEGSHCSVCGKVFVVQETIAALDHTEVIDEAIAPTCTATGLTEGKHCSVCNEVLVSQVVVDALGHTEIIDAAVAPTCTATGLTEGKHCSECEEVLVAQGVVDALGHTEVINPAVAPTCTKKGLTEGKHCTECGEVLVVQEEVLEKGHNYVDYVCDECEYHYYTEGLTFSLSDDAKSYSICGYNGVDSIVIIPAIYLDKPVTTISDDAFDRCYLLTNIIIPDSIISIGKFAFYGCSSLSCISIPNSVTSIGKYAFENCTSLENVSLTNNITNLENGVFRGCESLENIVIPEFVINIGEYTFARCSSLTSMVIPSSVTTIDNYAFMSCISLEIIYYTGTQEEWNSIIIDSSNDSYLINTTIHYNYVNDYTEGLVFTLSEDGNSYSVTDYLGTDVEVVIPSLYTFKPVTSIIKDAFRGSNITNVTIPSSITSISCLAFQGSTNLSEIIVDLNNHNYIAIDGDLYSKDGKTLIQYAIGKNASSFTIPDSVINIGEGAFLGCTALTNIIISNNVTSIGNGAFLGCINLKNISIPNGVTIINSSTFFNCNSLMSITIPNSVISIDISAFNNCNNLNTVFYSGTEEQWKKIEIDSYNTALTTATIVYY